MLKNHFKIALRNIKNNALFSVVNIIGLSLGLSASFVILAIIYFDFTFDKFHDDADAIYRITSIFETPEDTYYNPGVAVPLGKTLKEDAITGIAVVAPIFTTYPLHVENETTKAKFKNPAFVVYADGGYFNTINYQWLAGDKTTSLENPHQVVLSKKRANLYFPDTELNAILGKTLVYNDSIPVKVTGIVANFKDRTDLVFEEFISLKTANTKDMTSAVTSSEWNNTNSASQLFVKLAPNSSATAVQSALNQLAITNEDPETKAMGQMRKFYMQPLSDLHFDTNFYTFDFNDSPANKSVLYTLGALAVFLLLLGCINFINLNTAQALTRTKEIGIRKTLGSSKKHIIFQYLTETFALTITAAFVAVFLAVWLLNYFKDYISEGVGLELFVNPIMILITTLILTTVCLLSGFYPAKVLSNFKPISVLGNTHSSNGSKTSLRRYLTVFQFVIAQIFIIATLLVGKQLNYVMKKDMGFKTEAIAYFRTPWSVPSKEKKARLVKEIEAFSGISELTLGGNPPASFNTNSRDVTYFNSGQEINFRIQLLFGDKGYLSLYDIPLLAGRKPLNDSINEYVINETALHKIGLQNPADALGKTIKAGDTQIPIVGVMKDFNQRSLKSNIEPMAFIGDWNAERSQFNTIHIKLQSQDPTQWAANVTEIENIWQKIYPDSEFSLRFMDDTIARFYEQEKKASLLLNWATALAIFISCMGLLAMVVYTTNKRTKEIGIRKVLGASLLDLNVLLCSDFIKLIGLAFIIAIPIAWYGINYWLQDFAFKTQINWWIFAASGLFMLILAVLIMSIRTTSAANTNPVKSLRSE